MRLLHFCSLEIKWKRGENVGEKCTRETLARVVDFVPENRGKWRKAVKVGEKIRCQQTDRV